MAEVAKANDVPFVDLFTPTPGALRDRPAKPLTINGIHLNEHGDRRLRRVIDRRARSPSGPEPKRDAATLEQLRQAVLDKNFYWFNRYRTVDGYSIYGGRADLKFVDGQTNREVAAARDGSPRRDDRQPRQGASGPSPRAATSRSTTATRRRSSRS